MYKTKVLRSDVSIPAGVGNIIRGLVSTRQPTTEFQPGKMQVKLVNPDGTTGIIMVSSIAAVIEILRKTPHTGCLRVTIDTTEVRT
jgi:hypothetical protein